MAKRDFIVVSNRLPVTVSRQNGKLIFSPSTGGLATAMSSLNGENQTTWVGWPGIVSDDLTKKEFKQITKELKKYNCVPVFLNFEQVENYYEGYANDGIWPLFHYFQGIANFDDNQWYFYKQVNELFAKVVKGIAAREGRIWIHDYHLMLLPKILREVVPKATTGFFLHIPFPSYEVFRMLPRRKEILEGLLGANLVGFHVYDYVRHFNSSVLRILGHQTLDGSVIVGKRAVKSDAFPIGIDYKKFQKAAESARIKKEIELLNKHYGKRQILLSVDRLDYSKGIAKRLAAFERFLRDNQQYRKKVTMVVIAVPSRTEVRSYMQLRDIVEQAVSRINGTYATPDWTPISYQFQNLPFNKLVALYSRADVALVTPLRDGMNLVAKEYIASHQDQQGVLVLSELTGAADELSEAIIINPNDLNSVSKAIKDALGMPSAQKRSRITKMQKRIEAYDVNRWAEDFLEQLNANVKFHSQNAQKRLSKEVVKEIDRAYWKAKKRLIILDYDGTIKPIINSSSEEDGAPPKKTLQLVKTLAKRTRNDVYIISGRPKKALEQWFKDSDVKLVAEHGYWKKSGGKWKSDNLNTKAYKDIARPIIKKYESRTPGAEIEEKNSSLVWHYRKSAPELAYVRTANLRHDLTEALKNSDASVFNGHKILEVKPAGITKGAIVQEIVEKIKPDFILCFGDDLTDEDMFKVLKHNDLAHTIKVGKGETQAKIQVEGVDEVLGILSKLKKLI